MSQQSTYTNHFGIYALIESECGEKILLIKKARGPYKGLLDLPGGTPEAHEILEQTLCREVTEETGLDVDHCHQFKAVSSLYEFEENNKPFVLRHIGVLYHTITSGEMNLLGDGEDSNGPIWVKKSDILSRHVTPFVSLYLKK